MTHDPLLDAYAKLTIRSGLNIQPGQQLLITAPLEAVPLVRDRAVKLAPSTIGVLLEEKFSEEELKQLIAIVESPVNRKFLQLGGEMQKALGEKLVAETKSVIDPKVKTLQQAIAKRLGMPASPAPAAGVAKPASKAASK